MLPMKSRTPAVFASTTMAFSDRLRVLAYDAAGKSPAAVTSARKTIDCFSSADMLSKIFKAGMVEYLSVSMNKLLVCDFHC